MTMSPRPRPVALLMLGQARRERLKASAMAAALAWHRTWASEGVAAPAVEVAHGSGIRPRPVGRESLMLAAFLEEELLLHAQAGPDLIRALCTTGARDGAWGAFGCGHSPLDGALTEEVLRGLCEELVRAGLPAAACRLGRCGSDALEEAGAAWQKRALTLTVGIGRPEASAGVELHIAPRLADALAGARPAVARLEPLAARRGAADFERVSLTVTLGCASVAWRDLSALSVGDAIVLDQELGAPCMVSAAGSKAVAEAHLGRVDNSLAVQITRVLTAPTARTPSREN